MPLLPGKGKDNNNPVSGFLCGLWGTGRVYLIAAALLLVSVSVLFLNQFVCWSICAGEKPLVLVKNRHTARTVIDELLAAQLEYYGCPVFIKQSIATVPVWGLDQKPGSRQAAMEKLRNELHFIARAVTVVVDKEEKLHVTDMETGREILEIIKDKYRPRGVSNVRFEEEVELVPGEIPVEKLVTKQEALRILTGTAKSTVVYKVKAGDTLWDIAREKGLDLANLLQYNRDIQPHLLQIGQAIMLESRQPVLNVISRYEVVDFEELPYKTIQRDDKNLDFGEVSIIQQGVPGKLEITYCIVEKNGRKINKYPVKKVVKNEPRPKIVATGSKGMLASRSGHRMYRPVQGEISSPYGMRNGSMHRGLDFAVPLGGPVVAMMEGTVEFTGYRGGYGLLIDISHGNGIMTRYAHLSGVVVSPGDNVYGGQLIGRVGSTGNSTGPHLHFEVRINGESKDPAKFL